MREKWRTEVVEGISCFSYQRLDNEKQEARSKKLGLVALFGVLSELCSI